MALTHDQWRDYQAQVAEKLQSAGIVITPEERERLEIADFGLGHFETEGLGVLVYINTERCCAKELVMWPRQTCPQHLHPPVDGSPGKEETFRVRQGSCLLYVGDGPVDGEPSAEMPGQHYRPLKEVALEAGDQYTIRPNTWHWFQAGHKGAIISEFSTRSRDESDIFLDPNIRRMPEVDGHVVETGG